MSFWLERKTGDKPQLFFYNKNMKKFLITVVILGSAFLTFFFARNPNTSLEMRKGSEVVEVVEPVEETDRTLVIKLFGDLEVGESYRLVSETSKEEESVKMFEGIRFTLTPSPKPIVVGKETILTFNLNIDGRPAMDMQTHLGSFGNSVAVRRRSLEVVLIFPVKRVTPHGTLEFKTTFPRTGEYEIFTQFKRGGKFITTNFTLYVF